MRIDWPVASATSVLADSIRHWLTDFIASSVSPSWGEKETIIPPFGGGLTDGQGVVAHYGKLGMEQMIDEVRQAEADSFRIFGMSNELDVSLLCDTVGYLTMLSSYSVYSGGAHGGHFVSGATFNKKNGHRWGWDMIDLSKREQLISLLREGLRDYFEVKSDEEMAECLLLYDDPDTPEDESATLPLPVTDPYLTATGVCFVYQQYEIAAYALGLPSVEIPWAKIRPLLKQGVLE